MAVIWQLLQVLQRGDVALKLDFFRQLASCNELSCNPIEFEYSTWSHYSVTFILPRAIPAAMAHYVLLFLCAFLLTDFIAISPYLAKGDFNSGEGHSLSTREGEQKRHASTKLAIGTEPLPDTELPLLAGILRSLPLLQRYSGNSTVDTKARFWHARDTEQTNSENSAAGDDYIWISDAKTMERKEADYTLAGCTTRSIQGKACAGDRHTESY